MSYSFNEHLHRYSVWTAARAVQRGFVKTALIEGAIEEAKLRTIASSNDINDKTTFDKLHNERCGLIIDYFKENRVIEEKATYGRAAKIIAIYLKTSVVLPSSGTSPLAKIVHPPIDSILLTNVAKKLKGLFSDFGQKRWTQFDKGEYFDVIDSLRTIKLDGFWKIEEFWSPTND